MGALEDDLDEGVRICRAAGHDSWTTHADGSPCTPACPIHPDYRRPQRFKSLREANAARQILWNGGEGKTNGPLYAATELAGEVGEVCNVVKKLEREARGLVGSRASLDQLADELGDVAICLDLLASEYGIDMDAVTARKFNKTSRKLGFLVEMVEG